MPVLRSIRKDIDDRASVVADSRDTVDAGTAVLSRVNRFVWLVIGIIEALLMFRFIFKLLGAEPSQITTFLYTITQPFVTPFTGVFPTPVSEGMVLETAVLLSMLVVAIVGAALSAVLELFAPGRID